MVVVAAASFSSLADDALLKSLLCLVFSLLPV